ncbi:MAG: FHA domain-containing protein [Chromatiaceae bacterium]|nr:MAG: FHA domain-containing protein [Chromatiaceae bacterium]
MDIRRKGERRRYDSRPSYPFRDSQGVWVTRNRRRQVDRRSTDGDSPLASAEAVTSRPAKQAGSMLHTAQRSSPALRNLKGRSLLLHYRDVVVNLYEGKDDFLLGRRNTCDLVVPQDHVSREHARIVHEDGRFVLVEQSLNGTYLQEPSGDERLIHQETIPLKGSGYLSLGRPLTENTDNLVYFYCREANNPDPG